MKISIALSVVFASTATAFVAPGALFQRQSTTKLEASIKPAGWVATAVVGWTLATQIACATPLQDPLVVVSDVAQSYPTTLIAAGAYQPESGYDSLDFSMPSYKVEDVNGSRMVDEVRPGEPVTQSKTVTAKKQGKKEAGPSKAEISAAKVAKVKADRVTAQAEQVAKMDAMKAEKRAAKE